MLKFFNASKLQLIKSSSFCLIISIFACSNKTKNLFEVDFSLIQNWEDIPSFRKERKAPFSVTFSRNNNTLVFIASRHSTSRSSDTLRKIDTMMRYTHFDLVIVEGIPANAGISPQYSLKFVTSRTGNEAIWPGENYYAAFLAFKSDIRFTGGEPSRRETVEALLNKGYTLKDIVYFFTLRNLVSVQQIDNIQIDNSIILKKTIEDSRIGNKNALVFTESDFLKWYQKINNKTFNLSHLSINEVAPKYSSRLITNRISSDWERIRNEFLLKKIVKSMKENFQILVVFGAGHFFEMESALKNLFK